MNISRKPTSKKTLILIILAVIVILAAGIFGLRYALGQVDNRQANESSTGPQTVNEPNLDPPSDDEIRTGQDIKDQTVNTKPSQDNTNTTTGSLSVTANDAGDRVQVRTTIGDTIPDGSCSIVLKNQDKVITRESVGVQALPSYSTCKGWDIPFSELSSGTWTIAVTAKYQTRVYEGTSELLVP